MSMVAVSKKGRGCRFDTNTISFKEAKTHALKCAKQLKYFDKFPEMENRLENAKTVSEINRLMSNARKVI